MATTDQAKTQLTRVFVAYPSYRQWIEQQPTAKETHRAWIEMLTDCDQSDLAAVVDKIVSGDMEPTGKYDRPDALPRRIRSEANEIRSRRNAKQQQHTKYHAMPIDALAACGGSERQAKAAHEAVRLGREVRGGSLGETENANRLDQLCDWAFRDGPLPEYLERS